MKTASRQTRLKIRLYMLAIVGLFALAFVTWGLTERYEGRPSDEVDLASVWIDTVKEGSFVRSIRGAGVLQLREENAEDDAGPQAVIRIASQPARELQVGMKAAIDTRRDVLHGQVTAIGMEAEDDTVAVTVDLAGEILHTGMRDGLPVDATIDVETINNVTFIGRPAYGQANAVVELFKVGEDGSADRVQVRLGRMSVQYVEIIDGLEVGDRVILSDSRLWEDFYRIHLR